jgi:MFS transporter, PPP family, 3-phenylpropionic acid transporter
MRVHVENQRALSGTGTPERTTSSRTEWGAANWMISAGYVWFFAGIAAFTPFAAIYYRSLGFNGFQVGLLAALPAIGLALSGAMWGAAADTWGTHRTMLRIALGLGAIFAMLASRAEGFPLILAWIALLSFSVVPLRSLMDNYAVVIGEKTGRSFGAIRLWGAFGYTSFALTLGRLMNQEVTALFLVAYSVSLALTLVSTYWLPPLRHRVSRPLFDGLREMRSNRPLLLLLFVAYAQAVAASLIVVSLGVHITSLGGSTSQVGIAFAVAAVSELPVFIAGSWLVRRLGASRMLAIIIVLYLIRMTLLGLVDVPGWVIPLQAMHGVTFGAFLVAGVPRAHALAGQEHPATAQALLTMVSFGFGNITGSFLGGALMDITSTSNIFLGVAVMMAMTLVFFVIGDRTLASQQRLSGAERASLT